MRVSCKDSCLNHPKLLASEGFCSQRQAKYLAKKHTSMHIQSVLDLRGPLQPPKAPHRRHSLWHHVAQARWPNGRPHSPRTTPVPTGLSSPRWPGDLVVHRPTAAAEVRVSQLREGRGQGIVQDLGGRGQRGG